MCTRIQCVRGGGVLGSRPQTDKHLPKVLSQVKFFKWQHFALLSSYLIKTRRNVMYIKYWKNTLLVTLQKKIIQKVRDQQIWFRNTDMLVSLRLAWPLASPQLTRFQERVHFFIFL
jgi:hypothetical protein